MLSIISWRNVWRSKGRSFVVIGAIILGIWALTFAMGFSRSFIQNYIDNAINSEYAHIQIHHPKFQANKDIQMKIDNGYEMAEEIRQMPEVKSVTARSVISGMVNSAQTAGGVQIFGIKPEHEANVFGLNRDIKEGSYFDGVKRNPIIIGQDLAEKLHVDLKSKIVLTFTDAEGNIVSGAFRIAGIFKSSSPILNQTAVYVKAEDLHRLLNETNLVHEVALKIDDTEQLATFKNNLQSKYPDLKIQTWKELAPELELMVNQSSVSIMILLAIIMLALGFGIVNTMLMAVLERMKEIGMLMAIGMNKIRVFFMIILETVMLALIGGPIGLIFGYVTIKIFQSTGLDLSNYAEGLEQFGYGNIIYPMLELQYYIYMALGVIITAILGAVYPAIKAIKLRPVEALHKL